MKPPQAYRETLMSKYTGINHLAMATGDMDGTIRFWRDLLELRLIAALGKPGYRHYFFEVSPDDAIAFFEWPGVRPVEEKEHGRVVTGPFVFDHVSLGIESEDRLWEIKDRLSAAGVWVSEVIDHGFIHSIYAFDPNGIPIEFSWNVPDVDIRVNPKMADTSPTETAQEGADPRPGRWPAVMTPTLREERRTYPGQGRELFYEKKKAAEK
jgi:catechol 2,3-dioxygenase-like lactoylglutathione lyase family enzyme